MKHQSPASWSTSPFKNVAEVITGTTPSTQCPEYYGGSVPFVGPAELGGVKPITQSSKWLSSAGAKRARLLPAESILICCIGATIGKVGFSGTELATNQQINALVFDKSVVHPRYAFHYCRTLEPLIRHMGASTTLPLLPKGRFQEIEILLPPLEEQRRIAAILDKADAVRRQRQEAIALTEELLRAAFLEMFGDPVTNPKGWNIVRLGELARVTDGTHKTPTYIDSGVPFLSAKNIRAHKIDWEDTRFISRVEHESLIRRCYPKSGDVVLTKSGTIGEVAVVDRDVEFSLFESVALLKLNNELINPIFLATLLNNPRVRFRYGGDIKGVAVKHLHLVDIKRLPIIVPPPELQDTFLRQAGKTWEYRAKLIQTYELDKNLFNSLLQKAFRGEL